MSLNQRLGVIVSGAAVIEMLDHSSTEHSAPIRALMIEDDDYYYKLVSHLLSTNNEPKFEVTRASCLAEAVEYLSTTAPHVILLDLNLSDSRGLETLLEVQRCSPRAPVIVLTGIEAQELGIRSIANGAADFLVKQRVGAESIVRCICYSIERRKAEESRLRLLAIQDFTAALAHDLQIPLIGANQVLDSLLTSDMGKLTPFQSHLLLTLKESNANQLQLVQKLIEIYRYESGDVTFSMKLLEMKEIVALCVAEVEEAAREKGIVIVIQLAVDLKPVLADRDAMRSMLSSLIDNALKFSSPGGRIIIDADNIGADISLRVRNFGEIISPEDQLQMFDRFWHGVRGKKYVASTGLGLYRCQRILSFHQGKIVCSSSTEEGTTFSVTMPGVDRSS
jgi:signal transduction histidine kinase